MATTQRDIARQLGISSKSVARALNGHPKVSSESRRRVLEAARKLGYDQHSNREARALVARRLGRRITHNIVAISLPNEPAMRSMPYFADLLDGVEAEAQERNLDTFFFRHRAGNLPRLVQDLGVDGLVVLAATFGLYESIAALDLPAVTVGTEYSSIKCIIPDNCLGGCLATQHLIDLGHRRIAYIGHAPEFATSIKRLGGYRDALTKNGIPVDDGLIDISIMNQQPAQTRAAVDRLLAAGSRCTAVVTYNDMLGMHVLARLQEHGLRVPEDISVVGFDDITPQYGTNPPLTSVAYDRVAMGRRGVAMLAEAGYDDWGSVQQRTVFRVELRVRASTAAPVSDRVTVQ